MALQLFKIASTTVESPASSITFSSIPSGYTDLKLVWSIRSTADNLDITIAYNGSSANLTNRILYGTGSTVASAANAWGVYYMNQSTTAANTFSSGELYMPNYTGSNFKSMSIDTVTEDNATSVRTAIEALLWSQTAAITSLTLTPNAGSFATNSTATLYGVL